MNEQIVENLADFMVYAHILYNTTATALDTVNLLEVYQAYQGLPADMRARLYETSSESVKEMFRLYNSNIFNWLLGGGLLLAVATLGKKIKDTAESLGGADNPSDYNNKGGKGSHYSDKGSHKERSKANQPNHEKHWKKVNQPK